jgi:hypothetical protein
VSGGKKEIACWNFLDTFVFSFGLTAVFPFRIFHQADRENTHIIFLQKIREADGENQSKHIYFQPAAFFSSDTIYLSAGNVYACLMEFLFTSGGNRF